MAGTNNTLTLMIISKYAYNQNRWCYLGLDGQGRVLRPVPSLGPNEHDFFWPATQFSFEVGETHEFEIVPIGNGPNVDTLPHSNNDVHVFHKGLMNGVASLDMSQMFDILYNVARNNVQEALSIPTGRLLVSRSFNNPRQYVEEGENCQSCGIYRLSLLPNQIQLVIVETCRPLSGRENFNPRRCYLVEAGLVSKP